MNYCLAGKRILVTGAGRGIGKEIAISLTKKKAEVVAICKLEDGLKALKKDHPSIEIAKIDLSNWSETEKIVNGLGSFQGLVNNAGFVELASVGNVTKDMVDRTFDINVKAVINVTQLVTKNMIKLNKGGSIVNISSISSMRGVQDHLVYCASKGAVDQLTRVFALELGTHNIRVNSVNPTVTLTDMAKKAWGDANVAEKMKARIPLNRFAYPNEIADVVVFLLSNSSSMITGATIPVDGGFTAC